MSLAQILNKVEDITKRPDARSRALLSANSIIQDICNNADFPEDLVEVSIANPTPDQANFEISLIIPNNPNVRKIEYLVAGGTPLKYVKPRNVISNTGCVESDSYYRAGSKLNVRTSQLVPVVYLGQLS